MKLALKKLLQAHPSIQVSTLLSGSLSTPSAKGVFIPPTSFQSIATVSVGSGGTSQFEFTSIPSTFTHLQIRLIARMASGGGTTVTEGLNIQFNGDTGSNYSYERMYVTGTSTPTGDNGANQTAIIMSGAAGSSATSNVFGGGIIDIFSYANTNVYKTTRMNMGGVNDATIDSGAMFSSYGVWRSTSAITSIIIKPSSVNLAQYSHAALYGIRGS